MMMSIKNHQQRTNLNKVKVVSDTRPSGRVVESKARNNLKFLHKGARTLSDMSRDWSKLTDLKSVSKAGYLNCLKHRHRLASRIQAPWFVHATIKLFDLPYHKVWSSALPYLYRCRLWEARWGRTKYLTVVKAIYTAHVAFFLRSRTSVPVPLVMRLSRARLPRTSGLLDILKGDDPNRIRAVLSILKHYDLYTDKVDYNISSINTDIDRPLDLSFVNCDLTKIFKLPTFSPKTPGKGLDINSLWFISSKAGPNGSPAFAQWQHDARALTDDKELHNLWERLGKSVGLIPLVTRWGTSFPGMVAGKGNPTSIHSKLSFLSDKAGKTRVVAILDMWSQAVLRPIHAHLMKCLRLIENDYTLNQGKGRDAILKASLEGKPMYSFDLKSATDRLPRELAAMACAPILGEDLTRDWFCLLTKRAFHLKRPTWSKSRQRNIWVSESTRYAVGTPMGSLSCFAGGLALPHHLLVQQCAKEVGLPLPFRDYAILGDDIVIWDERVAKCYEFRVTVSLQMSISRQKSIIALGSAEFAKMLVRRGVVLTPLPWGLLDNARKYPGFLPVLLLDLTDRYKTTAMRLENIVRIAPAKKRTEALRIMTCPIFTRLSGPVIESVIKTIGETEEGRRYDRNLYRPGSPYGILFHDSHWWKPDSDTKSRMLFEVCFEPMRRAFSTTHFDLKVEVDNMRLKYDTPVPSFSKRKQLGADGKPYPDEVKYSDLSPLVTVCRRLGKGYEAFTKGLDPLSAVNSILFDDYDVYDEGSILNFLKLFAPFGALKPLEERYRSRSFKKDLELKLMFGRSVSRVARRWRVMNLGKNEPLPEIMVSVQNIK